MSQGDIGKDLPIAYASRTLNNAETNYSVIEKELLAIVWAVHHFRPYLYGRTFLILTDHRPVTWLFNCKDPSSRLIRWRLKLEEYNYTIKYKPGRVNSNVDALSRNPVSMNIIKTCFPINTETYTDFVKFHYENQNIPDIEIIKENIFTKFPNALFYSKDLDENNAYFENLSSFFDLNKITNKKLIFMTLFLLSTTTIIKAIYSCLN